MKVLFGYSTRMSEFEIQEISRTILRSGGS
jgi:hypothetical protein